MESPNRTKETTSALRMKKPIPPSHSNCRIHSSHILDAHFTPSSASTHCRQQRHHSSPARQQKQLAPPSPTKQFHMLLPAVADEARLRIQRSPPLRRRLTPIHVLVEQRLVAIARCSPISILNNYTTKATGIVQGGIRRPLTLFPMTRVTSRRCRTDSMRADRMAGERPCASACSSMARVLRMRMPVRCVSLDGWGERWYSRASVSISGFVSGRPALLPEVLAAAMFNAGLQAVLWFWMGRVAGCLRWCAVGDEANAVFVGGVKSAWSLRLLLHLG